jgi:hypothetical protein
MERTGRDERDQQAVRDTTREEAPDRTAETAGERFGWQRQRYAEVVDVHLILRRGDEVLLARRAGPRHRPADRRPARVAPRAASRHGARAIPAGTAVPDA